MPLITTVRYCLLVAGLVALPSCRPDAGTATTQSPSVTVPDTPEAPTPTRSKSPFIPITWTEYDGTTWTVRFPVADSGPKSDDRGVRVSVLDRYYDVKEMGNLPDFMLANLEKDPAAELKSYGGSAPDAFATRAFKLTDGSPAYQISCSGNLRSAKAVFRWIYANRRLYTLEVQGLDVTETDPTVMTFLDSFKPKK